MLSCVISAAFAAVCSCQINSTAVVQRCPLVEGQCPFEQNRQPRLSPHLGQCQSNVKKPLVFLSYTSSDDGFARMLDARLTSRNLEVINDERSLACRCSS